MSKKSVILHHAQVEGGKERKEHRQGARIAGYLAAKNQYLKENNMVLAIGFICFTYVSISTPLYMKWILNILLHNVYGV